ncbi:hypothetical protein NliqN6_0533 [Naganishia liquefaciens]|uniref:Uncharacterized protein n=1 Tax=Naganishia liquefaciens TaxID=104408 RepID=A0A8H3YDU5_9TREE|nr:hypothetical protein NliqN6_0533 [Naganishia liquefaciens]
MASADRQHAAAMMTARSPLSTMFLLHIALEAPLAIQGLFAPQALPFLEANNTTLVMIKLYAALSAASCITALLVFALPEYLPGKRAFAAGLTVYHTIVAGTLFGAPRFVPKTFGTLMESIRLTPENTWALLHAVLGLGFAVWWQGTLPYAQAAKNLTAGMMAAPAKK